MDANGALPTSRYLDSSSNSTGRVLADTKYECGVREKPPTCTSCAPSPTVCGLHQRRAFGATQQCLDIGQATRVRPAIVARKLKAYPSAKKKFLSFLSERGVGSRRGMLKEYIPEGEKVQFDRVGKRSKGISKKVARKGALHRRSLPCHRVKDDVFVFLVLRLGRLLQTPFFASSFDFKIRLVHTCSTGTQHRIPLANLSYVSHRPIVLHPVGWRAHAPLLDSNKVSRRRHRTKKALRGWQNRRWV